MRFLGEWFDCDDDEARPVIVAKIDDGCGRSRTARLLIDTGADTSLICYEMFKELELIASPARHLTAGIGGTIATGLVDARIMLLRDDGVQIAVNGPFIASTSRDNMGMSVLGRDVLDHFAVIVDRRGDTVCLLAPRHTYRIVEVFES